jgi:CheY-like chemotaxis protein
MNKLLSDQRLLVVEDEALVLMMIEDMLTELGCLSVTTAGTVESAISLIEGQPLDFAMLDTNLNGTSSLPIAAALAAREVPFIYCTGNLSLDWNNGYPDRPVLQKPFKYQELAALLARHLTG